MTTPPDIVSEIDAAISCQQCGGQLKDSLSVDFCGQECQTRWHATRAVPITNYQEAGHNFVGDSARFNAPEADAEAQTRYALNGLDERGEPSGPGPNHYLFIGGSRHGQFHLVPEGYEIFNVPARRRPAVLWDPHFDGATVRTTFEIDSYSFETLTYQGVGHLRLDQEVYVLSGVRGELNSRYAKWAMQLLLWHSGLGPKPRDPIERG